MTKDSKSKISQAIEGTDIPFPLQCALYSVENSYLREIERLSTLLKETTAKLRVAERGIYNEKYAGYINNEKAKPYNG